MKVYIFQCVGETNIFGLTEHPLGGYLPKRKGFWDSIKTIEVNLESPVFFEGVTAQEIITNIERDGYFIVDSMQFAKSIVPKKRS